MAESSEQTVEVDAKEGRFKVSGNNVISLLTFVLVILLCYGGFKHDAEGAERNAAIATAIRESAQLQSSAIKDSTQTQIQLLNAIHEQNCMARLDPKTRRESDIEFCRNLGRGR